MRIGVVSDTHNNPRIVHRSVEPCDDASVDRERGRLVFSPGESAGRMTGHDAVGSVDLDTLEAGIPFSCERPVRGNHLREAA